MRSGVFGKWQGLCWLVLGMLCCTLAQADESLLIAGGAGYKRPMEEVAQGFEAQSHVHVERFYGHMGQVLNQAKATGKVAMIFGEQEVLAAAGEPAFAAFLPLGRGRLVLAWAKGKTLKQVGDLRGEAFGRIALADTHQAIFGKAAMESLQHEGLASALDKRLMVVGMVPQVSAYLISGEVDAGFINLTEALAIQDKIGGYIEVPQADYTPVQISAGRVSGVDSAAVKAFVTYLQTPAAQAVFSRYGL